MGFHFSNFLIWDDVVEFSWAIQKTSTPWWGWSSICPHEFIANLKIENTIHVHERVNF